MRPMYVARQSRVHALLPSTKLALFLGSTYIAYILPDWRKPLILWFLVLLPGAFISKIWREFLRLTLVRVLPFILLVMGMGLVVLLSSVWVGRVQQTQGLQPAEILGYSATMAARIFVFLSGFLIFVQTTSPAELVAELVGWGVKPQVAQIAGSAIQLFDEVRRRAARIIEAQTARGIEWSGNIPARLRLLPFLIGPLIQGSLAEVDSRAIVMLARGYGLSGRRSFLHQVQRRTADNLVIIVTLAIVLGGTMWRLLWP